ncbi:hypothetical protein ACFW3D_27345 [Streptomyces sp. NPDC058864]
MTGHTGNRRPRARHLTVVTDTDTAVTPATQPALLDWHDASYFRWDTPCVPCGKLTPLRSHTTVNRPTAHKVCAEGWNAENPGKAQFVSDPPRGKRNNIHA